VSSWFSSIGARIAGSVGQAGRLLAFAATIALAVLAPGWRVLEALAVAIVLALLLSPEALRRAALEKVWLPLGLVALVLGTLVGDLPFAELHLSSEGLAMGSQMMARAATIVVAVHTMTSMISLSAMSDLFEKAGLRGLGFAVGVALNALPLVQRNYNDVRTALQLRGGFRRRSAQGMRMLLLATVVNSVHHAGDVVAAAEARGFSLEGKRTTSTPWRSGDWALLLLLAVSAGAILLR